VTADADKYQPVGKVAIKLGMAVADLTNGAVDLVVMTGKLAKDTAQATGNLGGQLGTLAKYIGPVLLALALVAGAVMLKKNKGLLAKSL
jgi:hypothetical protein